MAQDRTNMVSLLDIGKLTGGDSNIIVLGDGFTDLSEDWSPNTEEKQYVNQKAAATTVKGYSLSMTLEREYMEDAIQTAINTIGKKFPTGENCKTDYYRFYKTDIASNTGDCIKVPVTVCFSSTGGAGGDILTTSLQVNGAGDPVEGTVTISESGYSWVAKS